MSHAGALRTSGNVVPLATMDGYLKGCVGVQNLGVVTQEQSTIDLSRDNGFARATNSYGDRSKDNRTQSCMVHVPHSIWRNPKNVLLRLPNNTQGGSIRKVF